MSPTGTVRRWENVFAYIELGVSVIEGIFVRENKVHEILATHPMQAQKLAPAVCGCRGFPKIKAAIGFSSRWVDSTA
jgi:hypothetical protein